MQITLIDFMSLDGVVQAPGGPEEDKDSGFAHGGWSAPYFDVEVMGPAIFEALEAADALLFGDPYADRMNAITKYVASRTLTEDDVTRWSNSRLLPAGDAIGAVRELRDQDGRGVHAWGSADLARQLVEHDLVDEYVLFLEPILLGGGKRIFPETGLARPLELVSATPAKTGVLVCTYRPAGR
jgi:dihydrofolate reductase